MEAELATRAWAVLIDEAAEALYVGLIAPACHNRPLTLDDARRLFKIAFELRHSGTEAADQNPSTLAATLRIWGDRPDTAQLAERIAGRLQELGLPIPTEQPPSK